MKCVLCEEAIEGYDPALHRLEIHEARAVAICDPCTRRLVKWHGEKLARLFPTRAMKRAYGKRK